MKSLKTRRELLCLMLECGVDDLKMIDDMNCCVADVVNLCNNRGWNLTLETFTHAVFDIAIRELSDAVIKRFSGLVCKRSKAHLSNCEMAELQAMNALDPYSDFKLVFNYMCTEVVCESNLDLYKEFMNDELERFIETTGLEPIE